MNKTIREEITEKTKEIEEIIYSYLPESSGYEKTVVEAMNYTMKAGGKRLRPMLMQETYRMFGGEDQKIVEPFMAAIEMIHTYSLIHDDLPALDNDDYRRGKKTAHVVYGEDMAILAGDALLNYAFETACKAFRGGQEDITVARAMKILAKKPGIYGMIGGQTADVECSSHKMDLDTLLFIHENKTAALIECAMMIGAILAGASAGEEAAIEKIAKYIGIAFQIQDDVLDITGTSKMLGKPTGSDEKNQKQTYVTLKGLKQSKEDVANYTKEAIALFDQLGRENPFLRRLLISLIEREN